MGHCLSELEDAFGKFRPGDIAAWRRAAGYLPLGNVMRMGVQVAKTNRRKINTRIFVVLDQSGSMARVKSATISGFNEFLAEQKRGVPGAQMTLVRFASTVNRPVVGAVSSFEPLNTTTYRPEGQTALYDAIGQTLSGIALGDNERAVVVILTDGEENNSHRYNRQQIADMIQELQDENTWSFVYIGANQDSFRVGASLNIPRGNTMNYVSDAVGTQVAFANMALGMSGYTQSSKQQTTTFFTDLSAVDRKTVKRTMQDISGMVKVWTVPNECEIQMFIEAKTGQAYRVGSGYYQLTKPEKVQEGKHVLLMEKNTKVVYGNEDAREILGIPTGPTRIKPGNHGDWDVFIQSTSTNRKLVRGTKVIYFKY